MIGRFIFNNEKLCFNSSRDILIFLILLITSKSCVNSFFSRKCAVSGWQFKLKRMIENRP